MHSAVVAFAALLLSTTAMSMTPTHLRCEYLEDPLGIGETQPRLSWWDESSKNDDVQTAYQVIVSSTPAGLHRGNGDLWDSSVVQSDQANQVVYAGKPLTSRQQVFWKVRVWDKDGKESESKGQRWEMGLLSQSDWKATWVAYPNPDTTHMTPAAHVRKEFTVKPGVKRARVYATTLGLYNLFLDGHKVGHDLFAPGWTDYNKRIEYQTYDVTRNLKAGEHAIGAVLGDGWACGHVGYGPWRMYSKEPWALIQLEIEYEDGTTGTIASDGTWKVSNGPILYSDWMKGEEYDARKELTGWSKAGYKEAGWLPVANKDLGMVELVAQQSQPVRKWHEFAPKSVKQIQTGTFIVDLGQNMVGFARLKVQGKSGQKVQLRFAEVLNPDGTLYTENLRSATSTDTYTLKGGGEEVYEPSFTFHGFRYIEVTGYPATELPPDAISGIVVGSDTPDTMHFETSDRMVNQLHHNIYWGQRGNYLSVPTDCPQRDERLGWMGDAEVFAKTATYNCDVAAFLTKWLQDVRDAQGANGAFGDVSPRGIPDEGAPAWADAGVIVPWRVYEAFGDKRVLEVSYDSMKNWVEYVHKNNSDLMWTHVRRNDYGDWVSVNSTTPKEVLAQAYWAHSTDLLARTAEILGKTEDAVHYREMWNRMVANFNKAFVADDARIKGDTQTCYLLALAFDLLPEEKRLTAAKYLADDIVEKHNTHLSTGFLGVSFICPILTKFGYNDIAYKLLQNDTYPSWGYSIKEGATTIWERWDGFTKEKGFQTPEMNSFNHYSFGSIGEWMYSVVGGISRDPKAWGFKHIIIQPQPGGTITWANCAYDSANGRIECRWRKENGKMSVDVVIPGNTTADVVLPNGSHKVGSGRYHFES